MWDLRTIVALNQAASVAPGKRVIRTLDLNTGLSGREGTVLELVGEHNALIAWEDGSKSQLARTVLSVVEAGA